MCWALATHLSVSFLSICALRRQLAANWIIAKLLEKPTEGHACEAGSILFDSFFLVFVTIACLNEYVDK